MFNYLVLILLITFNLHSESNNATISLLDQNIGSYTVKHLNPGMLLQLFTEKTSLKLGDNYWNFGMDVNSPRIKVIDQKTIDFYAPGINQSDILQILSDLDKPRAKVGLQISVLTMETSKLIQHGLFSEGQFGRGSSKAPNSGVENEFISTLKSGEISSSLTIGNQQAELLRIGMNRLFQQGDAKLTEKAVLWANDGETKKRSFSIPILVQATVTSPERFEAGLEIEFTPRVQIDSKKRVFLNYKITHARPDPDLNLIQANQAAKKPLTGVYEEKTKELLLEDGQAFINQGFENSGEKTITQKQRFLGIPLGTTTKRIRESSMIFILARVKILSPGEIDGAPVVNLENEPKRREFPIADSFQSLINYFRLEKLPIINYALNTQTPPARLRFDVSKITYDNPQIRVTIRDKKQSYYEDQLYNATWLLGDSSTVNEIPQVPYKEGRIYFITIADDNHPKDFVTFQATCLRNQINMVQDSK